MSDPPSRYSAFLAELKRRRVFRVAAVYACIAFIIVQIVDGTFESMGIPLWGERLVFALLALGFPIAVALAWAFDLTEEGLVRAKPKREAAAKAPHHPLVGNKALAVIAALAIIVAVWALLREPSPGGAAISSIAVLPLENLMNDPDHDYFVDGMHDALISELGKIGALRVIGRTSAMRYKDTDMLVPEIAEELGVDALVEGSVLRDGSRILITAQLIGASPERHLWTQDYEREYADIISLSREVARTIAGEIRVTLTPEEEARLASTRPVDPEAHEAYLKGRYYGAKFTVGGYKRAIEYFEQVLEKDPNYALAHAGLAEAYFMLGQPLEALPHREAMPIVKAEAMEALEIDDQLSEAHASLGWVSLVYDWDWLKAAKAFKRAMKLNPSDGWPHIGYAFYLSVMGRHEDAIAEGKRAKELDPLDLGRRTALAEHFFFARQHDQAIEECQNVLALYPNFQRTYEVLRWPYEVQEMYEEAIATYQDSELRERLRNAYAASGRVGYWQERLAHLNKISETDYVPPSIFARIHAALGEKNEAFSWLEKAYAARDGDMAWLKVEPRLDPLRSDPRFQDLLQRMNFPE